MKKLTPFILAVAVSLIAGSKSYAGDVYLYGLPTGLKIDCKTIGGAVYAPLRVSCDFIGAKLDWDGKTKTVTIYNPASKNEKALARLTIGGTGCYVYDEKGARTSVELEGAPEIIDSYTYVPLTFIDAVFGLKTAYDEKTGGVFLE